MEFNEENKVRWEKLEEELDQSTIDPEQPGFSPEERNVLHFFKRLRARLRPVNLQATFPMEEGWDNLVNRIEADGRKSGNRKGLFRLNTYRIMAAAAVLLLLIMGTFYLLKTTGDAKPELAKKQEIKPKQLADQAPSQQIQLILADGQKMELNQLQSITEKNGVAIQAADGKLEYKATTAPEGKTLYNTLIVPRGKKTELRLPDGTRVWVNAASKITYPVAFSGITRELTMEGQAYFDVAKDDKKPFIVRTGGMEVEVLGTSFDVNAYEADIRTTLETGKVKVKVGINTVQLSPGQQSILRPITGQLTKAAVNTRLFTGWKDGELYLEDISLEHITSILERLFDYDFEFTDASLKTLRFTVDMAGPKNLQAVLDHISATTTGLHFTVSDRTVKVSR